MDKVKLKKPIKGEIWISNHGDQWLITDVYKKKKSDCIRLYDDDWNEAPTGTVFVYSYNESNNCYISSRVHLSEFLNKCRYKQRARKCDCPDCDKWHWNFYKEEIK